MFTAFLSWEQIQKVKDKSVKESIVSERQSRYSRNLWSSSYAWIMYKNMDISIESGNNHFDFSYSGINNTWIANSFTDRFHVTSIILNDWDAITSKIKRVENIVIRYHPYQMYCERGNLDSDWNINTWGMEDKLIIITHVNESKDYCFEIDNNNCRLYEISETKCDTLKPKKE